MRTSLGTLCGALILALLGSSAVMAQEADPSAAASAVPAASPAVPAAAPEGPVVVTGTLECLTAGTDAAASPAAGATVTLHEWQASDPRLSGEVAAEGSWEIYGKPSEETGVPDANAQAIYQIVNDGGAWLCEASRLPDPMVPSEEHALVFSGEGDYEGLTAYLHIDWSQAPYAFTGLILQGEAPPYAEPQG